MKNPIVIAEITNLEFPVKWERKGRKHRITYGQQVTEFTDDLKAAHEFGECVRHSAECAGKFDPDCRTAELCPEPKLFKNPA